MPKLQITTTNFTGGEFSPRLRGRVDLERYNSSAELLENCVVLRQGGVTIRPSRDYLGEIKSSAQTGRIIPFVFSRTDAYILEFGNLVMRVWKDGALVESSPGVPFELVTPWTAAQLEALAFTQGADTLIVAHGSVPTQRIRRFGDAAWSCEAAPFLPGAIGEIGSRSATISMSIDNVAVGTGRTVTASSSYFLAADVGREITWGRGVALITAQAGTTATVTVTSAFSSTSAAANGWVLQGSPQALCGNDVTGPVGQAVLMTLSLAGWRPEDVGKHVELKGGLARITTYSSSTNVSGIMLREMANTTPASPAGAWALLADLWNAVDGYPAACTFYQQRLWLGGTTRYPQTVWGSRTALSFDFQPGTADDDAVYKTIDSDEINAIQHLVSLSGLVVLTYGGEFDVRGGIEKPITQLNAQITMRSRWGCAQPRPQTAGRDVLFAQRGGRALRALFGAENGDGTQTRDVSVFSEHLLRNGVRSMAWEQVPEQVLWLADSAGKLVAVTYSDEQTTVAFASGQADGVVEWLASVPDGDIDATYCLTRYTVNGATKRYIERINWEAPPGQDCRKQVSGLGDVFFGFDHLEGKTVAVLADGVYVGTVLVTSGAVALPRSAALVSAGLPYTAKARLSAPEVGTGTGTAQAQAMSTNRVAVRFLETVGCNVNGSPLSFRQLDQPILDQPVAEFTGIKDVTEYGWQDGESPLELTQDQPYHWTVLSVVRTITVNQG